MDFKQYPPNSHLKEHSTWTKAALSSDQADPFCCSPEWQMAFHDAFSPDRRILIETASDNIVAFADYEASPDELYLTPVEAHWFFGSPLLGNDAVELFAEILPEIEKLFAPRFPKIIISGIQPEGDLPWKLFHRLNHYFEFYRNASSVQCAASLAGGIDGYLSRRSANHRKKLKKQFRLAKEAEIYFEQVAPTSDDEAQATYARMLAIEAVSWKGIEKCGMAEPPAKEFYDSMMNRLAKRQGSRIIFARHEGKDVGFIFGGMAGGVYRGQQFSYDDKWKDYSIGNLMQIEQVKWLCDEGILRYDMGPIVGPKMDYKKHWTEIGLTIETWVLVKK